MTLPPEYVPWLKSLGFNEISFGYDGLKLFLPEELDKGQIGYSKSREGDSLCDGATGSWKAKWIVIGCETLVGDPMILDTSVSPLRVTSTLHDEGVWEPYPIATSLQAFAVALQTIKQYSVGRENPVALEQNPLPVEDRKRALEVIQSANEGEVNLEFWELILESGLP